MTVVHKEHMRKAKKLIAKRGHAKEGSLSANWRASFVTFCKRWRDYRDNPVASNCNVRGVRRS